MDILDKEFRYHSWSESSYVEKEKDYGMTVTSKIAEMNCISVYTE